MMAASTSRLIHAAWGDGGGGWVLVGEVVERDSMTGSSNAGEDRQVDRRIEQTSHRHLAYAQASISSTSLKLTLTNKTIMLASRPQPMDSVSALGGVGWWGHLIY